MLDVPNLDDHGVVGRQFVLGRPNTKGQFVIVLNEKRYVISAGQMCPGQRVRVIGVEGDTLVVELDN